LPSGERCGQRRYFVSVVPTTPAIAPSVVCAALSPQAEVLVRERREHVRRLVPVRVPAVARLRAALVLAQADRRHQILEGRRVDENAAYYSS